MIAVFFVPYVIFEFPGTLLMKHFSPSKWIARIVISIGLVAMSTSAVSSFSTLLLARFFSGAAEAGFSSAVMMHLCFWYKPEERATRMAIFASSVALACAFGGLIASGISFLNGFGGLSGWQWLFILEGTPGVLVGLAAWFLLPDYPQTASWLTPEERTFAVQRLGPCAPTMGDTTWDRETVKRTLIDPVFWLYSIQYFLMTNALNAFGYFAPSIVANLGFSGSAGQLMTVPPNLFALLVVVGACVHSDRTQERSRHIVFALVFVATGYLVLASVENWAVRYAAVCIIACTNAAVLPFIAVSMLPCLLQALRLLTSTPASNGYCQGIYGNRGCDRRHGCHFELRRHLSAISVPRLVSSNVQHGKLDDICLPGRVDFDESVRVVSFGQPQRIQANHLCSLRG